MAEDWAIDVRKYVVDAQDVAIAGIVRHCGIALRSRDASLVSFTDPSELTTVRESFCRRKLGLTATDAELDAAIHRVGERMRADHTKNRVTVYYLLAEAFGKLGLFGATVTAAAAKAAPAPVAAATAALPAAALGAVAAAAATAPMPVFAAAAPPAMAAVAAPPNAEIRSDPTLPTAAIGCGMVGAILLIGAIVGSLAGGRADRDTLTTIAPPITVGAGAVQTTAPVAAAPAIVAAAAPATPTGSGVVAQLVAGKPSLSVYFDTAKTDISPDFAAAAAPVKTWVDSHPGARLAVSGFNDPRGNAAFNATLSKNRAKAVAAALATVGVAAASIDLVKPDDTTDATTGQAQARRVDVIVKDAG